MQHSPQTHVEGRVSLDCFIGTDGLVKRIEVKKGHPLLIQAATDAVSRWTFKRVMLNGKAVEVETIVNIDFQLPKDQKDTAGKTPALINGGNRRSRFGPSEFYLLINYNLRQREEITLSSYS